jgi:hypothetical protein
MASQIRQRLEHYYSRAGNTSEIMVALPVRSYLPTFERRSIPPPEEIREIPPVQKTRSNPRWVAIAAPVGLSIICAILFVSFRPQPPEGARSLELWTAKGDVALGDSDAPGTAVRLGPVLRDVDEVSARLDFTPNREAQQAGLIVWQDAKHFVRLGKRFFGRNEIEFLLQDGEMRVDNRGNTVFDPEGQSGQPLWLAIRRRSGTYRAYLSRDGLHWEVHGKPITPAQPLSSPRAGVYALNGRREAPSSKAVFNNLATGWTFDTASDFSDGAKGDWAAAMTCGDGATAAIEGIALRIALPANPGNCGFAIARPLKGEDWEISTRIDAFPAPGRFVGLRVQGAKGAVRVARYFLNGPSISFVYDGKNLVGKPDLNGSPAIALRLVAKHGDLFASYSADGVHFEQLPASVKLSDLGADVTGGIRFSTTTTDPEEPSSTGRFYYYRESIERLVPYR